MRYFKKDNEVYAFDQSQEHLITVEHAELTDEELHLHSNPQSNLTDEQKREIFLESLKPLTRRQFKLTLLANDMLDQIEAAIEEIQEPFIKKMIQIEYGEGATFERTSNSVIAMCGLLGLADDQVDEMWQYAMTL